MNQARVVLQQIYDDLLAEAERIQSLIEAINWDQMTPADHERIWNLILRLKTGLKDDV